MSQILYIASDYPLAKIENPHYKMLSVNEALAIGMENIPEFMLAPEFTTTNRACCYGQIQKLTLTQKGIPSMMVAWMMILVFWNWMMQQRTYLRRNNIEFISNGITPVAGRKGSSHIFGII